MVGVTRSMKSAGSRRTLATKYQRVRVTPPLFPIMGFCEAGTVWQRGRAGIGGGLLPLGIWTFCELKTYPSVSGEYCNAGRSRCSDVRRLEVETQLYLNHLNVKLNHLTLT